MSEPLSNQEVARFFQTVGDLMTIRGDNPFKVRAYLRAAETLRELSRDLHAIQREGALQEIPGIGEAIAAKIEEILATGRLTFLERLEAEIPAGVTELLRVPEIGPKSARAIYQALGIASLDALEAAAQSGQLRTVPGFGARSEARILAALPTLREHDQRWLLGSALPRAEALLDALHEAVGAAMSNSAVVGSIRRYQATVGDIDLLAAGDPATLLDRFAALPAVERLLTRDEASATVRLHSGEEAALYVADPARWGHALYRTTGSSAHRAAIVALAEAQGLRLDERGLWRGQEAIELPSEEALYEALGLPWIAPPLREGQGEVEAAREGLLPELVTPEDLLGDLHMHSTWSDGQASILEMAQAARALGYEYIVITDHSQSLAMTNGLSPERLIQQRYEIINVNAKFDDFAVLQGAEVEIKADGSLDYPDDLLAKLDVVVASMHTGIRGDRETVTQRMLSAIRNPHVDVIGHMTNRLLNRRAGADLDMEAVLQAAAEHGTVLEINSQPDRLDLDPTYARQALEYGCLLSVDSDAHHPEGLEGIRYGIMQAQRAWAEPDDILNTRSLEELLDYLATRHDA